MSDTAVKTSIFSKLFGPRQYEEYEEEYIDDVPAPKQNLTIQAVHRYQVTVRRQVMSFQDAVLAADGLKRGEQQVNRVDFFVGTAEREGRINDEMMSFGIDNRASPLTRKPCCYRRSCQPKRHIYLHNRCHHPLIKREYPVSGVSLRNETSL